MEDNQILDKTDDTIVPEAEVIEAPVAVDLPVENKPNFFVKLWAGIKEWFRKFTVKLKRKTQIIPLFFTLVTSFVFLCMIGTFSQMIEVNSGVPSVGICMFVTTLASILILPLFLNAFPKNKKPVIPFIVAVFVVYALIIAMDVVFLVNVEKFLTDHNFDTIKFYDESKSAMIAHLVLVSICVVIFALLPLYKKGINMINTKKVVESNDFSDEIDTSAEV